SYRSFSTVYSQRVAGHPVGAWLAEDRDTAGYVDGRGETVMRVAGFGVFHQALVSRSEERRVGIEDRGDGEACGRRRPWGMRPGVAAHEEAQDFRCGFVLAYSRQAHPTDPSPPSTRSVLPVIQ